MQSRKSLKLPICSILHKTAMLLKLPAGVRGIILISSVTVVFRRGIDPEQSIWYIRNKRWWERICKASVQEVHKASSSENAAQLNVWGLLRRVFSPWSLKNACSASQLDLSWYYLHNKLLFHLKSACWLAAKKLNFLWITFFSYAAILSAFSYSEPSYSLGKSSTSVELLLKNNEVTHLYLLCVMWDSCIVEFNGQPIFFSIVSIMFLNTVLMKLHCSVGLSTPSELAAAQNI